MTYTDRYRAGILDNPAQRVIQNPCLSLITLYGAMRHFVIAPVQNIKKPFLNDWKIGKCHHITNANG